MYLCNSLGNKATQPTLLQQEQLIVWSQPKAVLVSCLNNVSFSGNKAQRTIKGTCKSSTIAGTMLLAHVYP